MKDSEFIELVNLYLDHEISAADSARLEAEVQNNPARRQIYRQYCRMQKACKVLMQDFQTEAVSISDSKVVRFDPMARPSRVSAFYTVGAFAAAAACVAIILTANNRHEPSRTEPQQTVVTTAPATRGSVDQPVAATSEISAPASRGGIVRMVSVPTLSQPARTSSLMTDQLLLSGTTNGPAQNDTLLRAATEQAAAHFAWMENVRLAPIQQRVPVDQLRFEAGPTTLRTDSQTYGSPQEVESDRQMAAFRFQR